MQEHPIQAIVQLHGFDFLETFLNSSRGETELFENPEQSCDFRDDFLFGFVDGLREVFCGVLYGEIDDTTLLHKMERNQRIDLAKG